METEAGSVQNLPLLQLRGSVTGKILEKKELIEFLSAEYERPRRIGLHLP